MSRSLLCPPDDERLHDPVGDESLPWKDTWYLSVFDPASGFHAAMHMTVSANRTPDTRTAVGVRCGAFEEIVVVREDGTHTEASIGNSFAQVELTHLSWDTDHTLRWIATSDTLELDLTLTGAGLAPNFNAMFPDVYPSGKLGHSYAHTEQVIRARGTARLGGRTVEVDAAGWRDRGWGRRKNDMTFGSGYELVGGVLPDGSTFAFTGMRNVEHAPDAPLPVYGYWADGETILPAVGGRFYKDSMSYPLLIDLEFPGGRRVTGRQVARGSTLGVPFHDAEPELSGIAVHARDLYAQLADDDGNTFWVFSNEGHTIMADVTRYGRFVYDAALA